MKIEMWPVDRPVPNAENARKISDQAVDKVASSIQNFGFRQPIVVDKEGVAVGSRMTDEVVRQRPADDDRGSVLPFESDSIALFSCSGPTFHLFSRGWAHRPISLVTGSKT
jgi:hypothetical protein